MGENEMVLSAIEYRSR